MHQHAANLAIVHAPAWLEEEEAMKLHEQHDTQAKTVLAEAERTREPRSQPNRRPEPSRRPRPAAPTTRPAAKPETHPRSAPAGRRATFATDESLNQIRSFLKTDSVRPAGR